MSGLPPINLHSDKMLPAVYRRSDITRQVTIAGKQFLPGPPGDQLVDVSNNGYIRLRKSCAAPVEPGAAHPKGMLIDVWT
jgi:hypothetical protein